ncbi:circadian clock protein KaiB [Consotaella aegiceratis]|uniref:circadian clock protein KaiB n=1 Tax=Consotaella aegiceratis TaxID=3097961 RepID=UPI002F40B1DE
MRLFITGRTPHSVRALENLKEICETELTGRYEVEIVDVLENPQIADDDKVLATPTLVRKLPEPVRKIIGDLSDRDRVLLGLDIFSSETKQIAG